MLEFVAEHSKKYDKFSNRIETFRKNDDIVNFIEIAFIELEKTLNSNIKYLGYTVQDLQIKANEYKTNNFNSVTKQNKKKEVVLHVKDTYEKIIKYRFELTVNQIRNEETLVQKYYQEVPIHIPLLIDKYHYKIRGNKYCAPLQIIDSLFYSNQGDIVILKTLARAIVFSRSSYTLVDIFGNEYLTYTYFISIVSKIKSPLILFFFAYYGFENTFKLFGAEKFVQLVNFQPEDIPNLSTDKLYFKFCKYYLAVDKKEFIKNTKLKQFIACVIYVQKRNITYEQIQFSLDKWLSLLGNQILEINSIKKGKNMLYTFDKSLDYITKSIITKTIENGYKKSINMWNVAKWIFFDFNNLTSKTTVDMMNKRIRLGEYIVSIVVKQIYKKLYKFMNKLEKNKDMKWLQDIFKINPNLIPYTIIGKYRTKTNDLNLNIVKFCEYVNDNDLFNACLTMTSTGPGSPIEKSKKSNISISHRKLDPSMVGKIGLIEVGASDPGLHGIILPMTDIDLNTDMFTK